MDELQRAVTFSSWAVGMGFMFPPLAVMALLALIVIFKSARKQRLWSQRFLRWTILAHGLFFPAVIAVGVLLPAVDHSGVPLSPNKLGRVLLDILTYASLCSCGFWIWTMKGYRWFTAGLITLMELPILGALLVAGMSVSGDWL